MVGFKDNIGKKNKEGSEEENNKNDEVVTSEKVEEKDPPIQHLPYPHAPLKKDKERQYQHFIDIFKQLQINIPFSEALEQMATYEW